MRDQHHLPVTAPLPDSSPEAACLDGGTISDRYAAMTFADVAPMLERGPEAQQLALLLFSQLATAGSLTATQRCFCAERSIDFVDPGSPHRSPDVGVRRQAMMALESLGSQPEAVRGLDGHLLERVFSVLATLPVDRLEERSRAGTVWSYAQSPLAEPDEHVREIAERIAKHFDPAAQIAGPAAAA